MRVGDGEERGMGEIHDFLSGRLRRAAPPYLFVGSGLSRRYLDTPDWRGLLRHFAAYTPESLEVFLERSAGSLPQAASLLATEFAVTWHADARFADSRREHVDDVADGVTPLKIEVARYFRQSLEGFAIPAKYSNEYDLLQVANVDAIITTNYDSLLSCAYPDYAVYRSQDDLLFSEPQGIAEIYMIHGSADRPGSLVLTQEDYVDFRERDAYLAAKLLTFFAERPIIFVGYSLSDENVRTVLSSLVRALRGRNANRLRDRLFFIVWKPSAIPQVRTTSLTLEGVVIEAYELVVSDFMDVFRALGGTTRALPARVLRHLKQQVYQLVAESDPQGRLVQVSELEANDRDIDIVFGVGAKMAIKGVIGLSRWDLVDDLISQPALQVPGRQIISELFAVSFARTWYVPYWKYLREAGFVDGQGALVVTAEIPAKVRDFATRDAAQLGHIDAVGVASFQECHERIGLDAILKDPWLLAPLTRDVEGLTEFLRENRAMRSDPLRSTAYAKLAVLLDWMKFGPKHLEAQ